MASAYSHGPPRDRWPSTSAAFPFAFLGLGLGWVYLNLGAAVVPLLVVPILIARSTFASYLELKAGQEQTIETLILALEAKDRYTAGHAQRVATFSEYVGAELAFGERRMERLRYAALMHDIGKLVVPNQLLNKPGRLTEAEFERVKRHEPVSVELLRRIDFLAPVAGDTTTEAATAAVDGIGPDRAGDHPRRRRVRRHDLHPVLPAGAQPGDRVRRAPRRRGHPVQRPVRRGAHRRDRTARRALRRRPRGRRARLGGRTAGGRHRFGRASATSSPRSRRRVSEALGPAARPPRSGVRRSRPGSRSPTRAAGGHRSPLIGGAIAAGELIELKPPAASRAARSPSPSWSSWPGRRRSPDGALVLVIAELADLPGPLGAGVGRGAVWRCSSSASSRAWPRSSCTTG